MTKTTLINKYVVRAEKEKPEIDAALLAQTPHLFI